MSRLCATRLAVPLMLVIALAAGQASAAWVPFVPDGNQDVGDPAGGDPAIAGSMTFTPGMSIDGETVDMFEVLGGGSDWWNSREAAQIVYKDGGGDMMIFANVAPADFAGNGLHSWSKSGVFFRADRNVGPPEDKSTNALMAATGSPRMSFQWRANDTDNMNHNTTGGKNPWAVALKREGDDFTAFAYNPVPGVGWVQQGSTQTLPMGANPAWGLATTSHDNSKLATGWFWDVQYTTDLSDPLPDPVHLESLQGPVPRVPGSRINDPEGTGDGVAGGWSALEVVDNGNMGTVDDAVRSLEDGGGTRYPYTRMGTINIKDGDGDAANFGGDGNYGVADAGIKPEGSVDNIAFLARGRVNIPTAGDWSFYIRSDDGEELSVDNGALVIGTEGWQDNNFGTVALTAGVHKIQVIHREAGGGADLEVAAANGATTNLNQFRLIGSGDPGEPASQSIIPGLSDVSIRQSLPGESGTIDNLTLGLAAMNTSIANGTTSDIVDTVVHHGDVDTSTGAGAWPPTKAFPFDQVGGGAGTDDNDFAILAEGAITIDTAGTYFIGYNGDDGVALAIPGQTWLNVVEDATGAGAITTTFTADDTLITDIPTGWAWTVGEIDLAAGSYDFSLLNFERGGGAFVELFGGSKLGVYDLLEGAPDIIIIPAVADALELVPEPSTWAMLAGLLAMGLMGLLRRAHRKA